jgi:predicted transcriptional regulator
LPEVTQPTSDALVKAMAKNPASRFLSYDEFVMALTNARSQLLVRQSQAPPLKPKSLSSWWRR